jgi:hypothetical protein
MYPRTICNPQCMYGKRNVEYSTMCTKKFWLYYQWMYVFNIERSSDYITIYIATKCVLKSVAQCFCFWTNCRFYELSYVLLSKKWRLKSAKFLLAKKIPKTVFFRVILLVFHMPSWGLLDTLYTCLFKMSNVRLSSNFSCIFIVHMPRSMSCIFHCSNQM